MSPERRKYTPDLNAWLQALEEREEELREGNDIEKADYLGGISVVVRSGDRKDIALIATDIRIGLAERMDEIGYVRLGIALLEDLELIRLGVGLIDPSIIRPPKIKRILKQIEAPK